MGKVSHNNIWRTGAVQIYVEPPPIPLIKSRIGLKTERDYVKIRLRRNPTSENLDIHEFKIAFFTMSSQSNSFCSYGIQR